MKTRRFMLVGMMLLMISSGTALAKGRNAILVNAMSPYEDLTEYALAGNETKVKQAIASLNGSVAEIRDSISVRAVQALEANIKEMQAAESKAAFPEIALLSVDSYKVIAGELDQSPLDVPIQVVNLDYVGFRIHALLKQEKIDWRLVSETADEGKGQWKEIEKRVSDNGLHDSVNTAIEGLEYASTSKNIDMLGFAAQVVLDLVDLLEGYFQKNK